MSSSLEHELVDFQLPENLPSSILMNRPDIRQAEYQLKAANADIGAARAAFFPSISLTGNAGFASNDIHHLFNGTNLLWSFTPQVDLPIFTAGKRLANLKISHLQQKSMVEHYQQTVKQAFTEIAKELYAHQSLSKQSEATHQTQESTQQRLQAERIRYQTGLGSYRELLDAERDYYRSTQAVLQTDLQRLINHIQLYASLGGGRK